MGLLHTDTPISGNAANSSQVSGIQTFAIANSTANNCKQHNSQKTVISANRQIALENIGKMGVKEMLSIQQCSSAGKVIDYAVNSSDCNQRFSLMYA